MKKKGFTLIEVITVIIIIGILLLITVPAITEYIAGGRDRTYEALEETMRVATDNKMVECLADNGNCEIPSKNNNALVYLKDLVSEGYVEELKDPSSEGYCNKDRSYVLVKNQKENGISLEYQACLVCSNYNTDSKECVYLGEGNQTDNKAPICGKVTGASTNWTNETRTISIACTDEESGCIKDEYVKTFGLTAKKGIITIHDKVGNSTECEVDVNVDKDKPTCNINVVKDGIKEYGDGWYASESGSIEIEITSRNDTGSGILTYGIGTSYNTPEYNKKSKIKIGKGITTVFGYVKDYAGNKNQCFAEIKVGDVRPEQTVEYGYQVYPNKESYTLTGANKNGNLLTFSSTTAKLEIKDIAKYKDTGKVKVYLNKAVEETITARITTGGITTSRTVAPGSKEIEFTFEDGTYQNITLEFLVSKVGYELDINRIELITKQVSPAYTNKNITLYAIAKDNLIGITGYSFDNGVTYSTSNTKIVSNNSQMSIKLKDKYGNVSENETHVSINKIDKLVPQCTLKAEGQQNSSGIFLNGALVSFATYTDKVADIQNAKSDVRRYGMGSVTGSKTDNLLVSDSEKTFTGYIEDNAGNVGTCSITLKGDSTPPTVTYSVAGGTYNTNKSVVITPSDVGSGIKYYHIHIYKNGTMINQYNNLTSANYTVTLSGNGNYTIYTYVIDNAGNVIVQAPNNGVGYYYQNYTIDTTPPTVTYSVVGGTFNTNKSFVITPSDAGSGVNYYHIHIYKNGTYVQGYNRLTSANYTVTLSGDGDYSVYTYVIDKAGNVIVQAPNNGAGYYYQSYRIDTTPPVCNPVKTNVGTGAGVTITPNCYDALTGLRSATGVLTGVKGNTTITATDNVGNVYSVVVPVTAGQSCNGYWEHWCCEYGWCGGTKANPACCDSYRCPEVYRPNCSTVYN